VEEERRATRRRGGGDASGGVEEEMRRSDFAKAARVSLRRSRFYTAGTEIPKVPRGWRPPPADANANRKRFQPQWLTCGASKGGAHMQPEAGNNLPLHGVS
jgi:hypothetical protein